MSVENPILDALEVSVIINRKDVLNQRFWTEWRAGIAVGCPANPGDLVMLGPLGTIDPCLLPPGSGDVISVNGYTGVVVLTLPQTFVPILAGSPPEYEFLTGYDAITGLFSTAPAPNGSGAEKVTAIIDFVNADSPEDTTASVTVTGQTWVTTDSIVIAGFGGTTVDHGPDDAMAENLSAYVENIVPGVGFDITAHAPLGTWGQYQVWALGAV